MWERFDSLHTMATRTNRPAPTPATPPTGWRRHFRPWWLAVIAAALLLPLVGFALGGRGGSSGDSRATGGYTLPAVLPAATAAAAPASAAYSGAAAATAAPAAGSRAATGGTAANAPSDSTGLVAPPANPQTGETKIIRNGTISLSVKDVAGTMNAVWNTATDLGGYVVSSSTQGTGDDARGEITLRVPSDQYVAATERLRGYGVKVLNEKSTSQDVSEEYVDLQARQRNLELTVAQLQTLLGQARTVDETLKVQAQLNNVQGDLERVRGRLKYYDNRAAFSTITASLISVPAAPKIQPPSGWSPATAAGAAWERSLRGLQTLVDVLLTVVIGGWWLILLAVGAFLIGRRALRRRAATGGTPAVVIPVAPVAVVTPAAPPAP